MQTRVIRDKSFTLVEIILVTLIISVIATLTIPNLSQTYLKYKLKESADGILHLMRYAQSRAITQGVEHRLKFNEDSTSYQLSQKGSEESTAEGEDPYQAIKNNWGRTFKVADDIDLEPQTGSILFTPDGKIEKTRIYVCHKERCLTISTKEQRGRIRIFDSRLE